METNKSVVLRKATMGDAELLFQWKNDPDTIANSITKRGVTMEEHIHWLQNVIHNSNRQLFILEIDGVPVGQLRLDMEVMDRGYDEIHNNENVPDITAEISYGLALEHRGKGLGRVLLEQAEGLAKTLRLKELTAEVLPHNIASMKLFRSLGFEETQNSELVKYVKTYR